MVYSYKINTTLSIALYGEKRPDNIEYFLENETSFLSTIDDIILKKIQKNYKLVVFMADEGDISEFQINIINLLLEKYNIPFHNFYFIHNVFNFPNCKFNQLYHNSHLINAIKISNDLVVTNLINTNHTQKFKFHFPIRRFRKHRIELLEQLFIHDNTFIENNLVSFNINFLNNNRKIINLNTEFVKYISTIQKKVIDIDNFNLIAGNSDLYITYENSCITIVTETMFYEEYNYLSEKVWKPLIHQHPFILLGRPYVLKSLHKLGFKTFSSIIDESYDNELDNTIRFNMVLDEIIKLNNYTIAELIQKVNSIKDILIFNQNHLLNMDLSKLELEKNNFIFENQSPSTLKPSNNIL